MVDTGHIPERRCLGCGTRAPKPSLRRFVVVAGSGGHELARDTTGRHGGRGLYVCARRACFELAVERRAFHRGARIGAQRLAVDPSLADDMSV
jgi:predicted RNA-binding protein YlxR (DUF448 family)